MVNGTAVHISRICIECVISHVGSQNAAGPHPLGHSAAEPPELRFENLIC
jgi:hypothetical protein